MHTIILAIKYLTRRKIALFAVSSVALCVALMIIITSLFNGFLDKFTDFWQYEYGQIYLSPSGEIDSYAKAAEYLESMPEVENVRLNVTSGGLLLMGRGNAKMVTIKGIDLGRELQTDKYKNSLLLKEQGKFELSAEQIMASEKWLEKKLRRKLTDADRPVNIVPCIMSVGLLTDSSSDGSDYDYKAIKDELENLETPATIFSASFDSGDDNSRKAKRNQYYCWPINASEVGSYQIDENTLYLPFEYVVKQFDADARFLVTGKAGVSDEQLLEALQTAWIDYGYNTLNQSYEVLSRTQVGVSSKQPWLRMFIGEIQKQLLIMKVILGFVCLIASVLIFVILMMVIINKRRDIGIIRATGGSRGSVSKLFLNYGLTIGTTGTLIGLLCGFIIVNNIEVLEGALSTILGFKIWSAKSYAFSEIPDKVHLASLWWIIISGIFTAGLGAVIPAFKAARTEPAQSLRFE